MANRDLIVIGGSAGSIAPLKTILASLPADLTASVLVVIHIPANSTGIHTAVASAAGPLPVVAAEDGMTIETGHVYIAPPNRHLLVFDDTLKLGHGPRENHVRPAIDPLFRSAAAARGPRAIGVLLSGKLDDGASGLEAIKLCGGIALVQSPHDAQVSEMPLAALEATSVDLSADALAIAHAVKRYVREEAPPPVKVPDGILLEIDIAAGGPATGGKVEKLARPSTITCPDCGGVLSEVTGSRPLRFRCQVGHSYTAKKVLQQQEDQVDEAMRVALRIIEERANLVERMGREAAEVGRSGMAELYADRAAEYRGYGNAIRHAILASMKARETEESGEHLTHREVLGAEERFDISETSDEA
ncbi:MAG TPA: chemotaxis protein CheB [Rhizobiaceae bacterium]|nr:chemotaxis protein CheB [Rhizobiaceae bacterium]